MTDEDKVVNTENDQAQVESPTTEEKSPEQSEVKESESRQDEQSEPKEKSELTTKDVSADAKSESKKPDKTNRRIQDLVGKIKSKDEEIKKLIDQQPRFDAPDPYESLGDTLTQDDLKNVVTTEAMKIARMEIARKEAETKYVNAVEEHVSDLENVAKQIDSDYSDDPETAKELNDLLVTLNEQANFDSQGRFVPRVKTSTLYQRMKKALVRERESGEDKAISSVHKDISTSAIRPSTKQDVPKETQDLKAMMWKNPGKVAEILEAKLSST